MQILFDFFKNDFIALLGVIVLFAGIVLLLLTIKNLFTASEEEGEEAEYEDEYPEETPAPPVQTASAPTEEPAEEESTDEMSLLDTYLRSISEDLSEIKQRLISVESKAGSGGGGQSSDEVLTALKSEIETQVKAMAIAAGPSDPAKINKDLQEIKLRLSAIHKIISNLAEQ